MPLFLLILVVLPATAFYGARIFYPQSIAFNEGWNAFHAARLLAGQPLYPTPSEQPPRPLNYPPLSFLLTGLLQPVVGNVVLVGRILSYVSLFVIAALIWCIVDRSAASHRPAWLAAFCWLAWMSTFGGEYVGMNDPQLLGLAFSVGALFLYARSRERLQTRELWWMALLCCVALFTKLILVAVPIALTTTLLVQDRRRVITFAAAGLVIFASLTLVTWLYAGPDLVTNVLGFELARTLRGPPCGRSIFVERGGGLFLIACALVTTLHRREWTFVPIYFACSLLFGCFAVRGAVDVNAWFDLFVASSLLVGCLATEVERATPFASADGSAWWRNRRVPGLASRALLVILVVPPLVAFLRAPSSILDYGRLARGERDFRDAVAYVRAAPGPALADDPLLLLEAGKEFTFDPFAIPQLVAAGRLSDSVLVDPIGTERFTTIVLNFELEESLRRLEQRAARRESDGAPLVGGQALGNRWMLSALRGIAEHYRLLWKEGTYFVYVPR